VTHYDAAVEAQDDPVIAAVNLIGRTGATNLEIGYLHDNVPPEEAGWYAYAQYQGARVTISDQRSPDDAVQGLAIELLTGAKCMLCGRLVSLNPEGTYAKDTILMDGTPWLAEQQAAAGICVWRRDGPEWKAGCKDDKKQRRGRHKRRR